MTKKLIFQDAFLSAQWFEIEAHLKVRVLHLNDLIIAKKAAGRNMDLDDLEHLQS
jgi:hypothetical protein